MAADGSLTRDTHVWTAGQDGWKRAEDVAELVRHHEDVVAELREGSVPFG